MPRAGLHLTCCRLQSSKCHSRSTSNACMEVDVPALHLRGSVSLDGNALNVDEVHLHG
jgi:hypothetical protein